MRPEITGNQASTWRVIVTITSMSFGIAGVVNEKGARVGVITDGDIRRHLDGLLEASAADVMTRDPVWVSPGAFVEDALTQLNKHKITAMFASLRAAVFPGERGRMYREGARFLASGRAADLVG